VQKRPSVWSFELVILLLVQIMKYTFQLGLKFKVFVILLSMVRLVFTHSATLVTAVAVVSLINK